MSKNAQRVRLGAEAAAPGLGVDYIVPYPYSSNIEIVGDQLEPRLSVMSRMSIDAAVSAWEHNPEAKIVLAGETLYGPDYPNTTDLMVERAKAISDIDDDSLVPLHRLPDGTGLNNTYLQTQGLKNYFEQHPGKPLVIALNYHLQRVMHTAKAYGLEADFARAESILGAEGVNHYNNYLPIIAELEKSEKIIRLINHIDQKGRLFNLMMRRTGPRLVDVVEVDDELQLVQSTAKKKQQRLIAELSATQTQAPQANRSLEASNEQLRALPYVAVGKLAVFNSVNPRANFWLRQAEAAQALHQERLESDIAITSLIVVGAEKPLVKGALPNEEFAARLDEGARQYLAEKDAGNDTLVYVTGSRTQEKEEQRLALGDAGKNYLINKHGVPKADIRAQDWSRLLRGDKGVYNAQDEADVVSTLYKVDPRFKNITWVVSPLQKDYVRLQLLARGVCGEFVVPEELKGRDDLFHKPRDVAVLNFMTRFVDPKMKRVAELTSKQRRPAGGLIDSINPA